MIAMASVASALISTGIILLLCAVFVVGAVWDDWRAKR